MSPSHSFSLSLFLFPLCPQCLHMTAQMAPSTSKLTFFQLGMLAESTTFTIMAPKSLDLIIHAWISCPPQNNHYEQIMQYSLQPPYTSARRYVEGPDSDHSNSLVILSLDQKHYWKGNIPSMHHLSLPENISWFSRNQSSATYMKQPLFKSTEALTQF